METDTLQAIADAILELSDEEGPLTNIGCQLQRIGDALERLLQLAESQGNGHKPNATIYPPPRRTKPGRRNLDELRRQMRGEQL